MARNPRRIRPERSVDELLANEVSMEVLRAVATGRTTRAGSGPTAGHLLDGHSIDFTLRRLADEDRVYLPMIGLPRLWGDAELVLEQDRVRRSTDQPAAGG